MNVWAVANQKGGVGKTTTAVACAGLLAESGARVLMIDLDPHGSLTAYFRYNPDTLRRSSFQLFGDFPPRYRSQINEMLLNTSLDTLRLLPAGTGLATVERDVRKQSGIGRRVQQFISVLGDNYDHVIIDTPPVFGVLMVNALSACQQLLLPVQTDYLAIKGLERMMLTLGMVARAGQHPLAHTVIPTLFDPASPSAVAGLRRLRATFAPNVSPTVIPLDNNLREASAEAVTPSQYAPYSRSVKAYRNVVKDLLKEDRAAVDAPEGEDLTRRNWQTI